jgi:gliding motility-associated-like protein
MRWAVFFVVLSIIHVSLAIAQNLVPNPGFEEFHKLPCDQGANVILADYVKNWFQPISTSSDYWNDRGSPFCAFNPRNTIMVTPLAGNGMAGIITGLITEGARERYQEYLEVKLVRPLTPGKIYQVGLHAYNKPPSEQYDVLEADNLGMVFSDTIISYSLTENFPSHLSLPAQLRDTAIVQSNSRWKKISGCFAASTPHEYMLVGNFESIKSTLLIRSVDQRRQAVAYHLIDEVSVHELTYDARALKPSVDFCHDRDEITLDAVVPGATAYKWETGESAPSITISEKQTKEYTVKITVDECSFNHVIRVNYIPDVDIGRDTLLCNGEEINLNATHPIKKFQWSTGSTDSVLVVNEPGTYSVQVNTDCPVMDSVTIDVIDCPGFVPNIITPNADGLNDFLVFENIENRKWSLQVYNRWGGVVYETARYQNEWGGAGLRSGVYFFRLTCASLSKSVKGWIELRR